MKKKLLLRSADPNEIAELVKQMRAAAEMTQATLSDQIGLGRSSLANIERGQHTISLADLMKIAEVTGHTMTILVTDR